MSRELCENCGKPVFFNHHVWSSGRITHGLGGRACREAARAVDRMPAALDAAIQALVETSETVGRLIFEADDDEYADVKRLQGALLVACETAARGIEQVSAELGGRADG